MKKEHGTSDSRGGIFLVPKQCISVDKSSSSAQIFGPAGISVSQRGTQYPNIRLFATSPGVGAANLKS